MPTQVLYLAFALAMLAGCAKQDMLVTTTDGELLGFVDEGVEHYLGIP